MNYLKQDAPKLSMSRMKNKLSRNSMSKVAPSTEALSEVSLSMMTQEAKIRFKTYLPMYTGPERVRCCGNSFRISTGRGPVPPSQLWDILA